MQQIAIDTSDFPKLRGKGVVYVDKTAYLHRLMTGPNDCFFIARPRRFGKSLMISTLKAIFEGRRELFDGLAISRTDWKWETYPVIHFEFNDLSVTSIEEFEKNLANHVEGKLLDAGFSYDLGTSVKKYHRPIFSSISSKIQGIPCVWRTSKCSERYCLIPC